MIVFVMRILPLVQCNNHYRLKFSIQKFENYMCTLILLSLYLTFRTMSSTSNSGKISSLVLILWKMLHYSKRLHFPRVVITDVFGQK